MHKGAKSTAQSEDEMERGLLLDVVVRKGSAVLELLAREDEALLVRGDALLVLDLNLDIFNGVTRFDIKRYCFTCESLYKYLHIYNK